MTVMTPEDARAIRVIGAYQHLRECAWRIDAFRRDEVPIFDVTIMIALLESCFLRGRYLIEFFLGGGGDVVHLSSFAPNWSLPKEMKRALEAQRTHISQHMAHLLESATSGDGGYRVDDLVSTLDKAVALLTEELERRGSPHAGQFRYTLRLQAEAGQIDMASLYQLPGGPWNPR